MSLVLVRPRRGRIRVSPFKGSSVGLYQPLLAEGGRFTVPVYLHIVGNAIYRMSLFSACNNASESPSVFIDRTANNYSLIGC